MGPAGPAGSQVWSSFILYFDAPATVASFTPDTPITVTRIQMELGTSPSGCTNNAVVELSDGTVSGTYDITLNGGSFDSGSIAIAYAAGTHLKLAVVKRATCKQVAVQANVVVQYHAD